MYCIHRIPPSPKRSLRKNTSAVAGSSKSGAALAGGPGSAGSEGRPVRSLDESFSDTDHEQLFARDALSPAGSTRSRNTPVSLSTGNSS